MRLRALNLLLALFSCAALAAQDSDSAAFDRSRYLPGTLEGIIAQHGDAFGTIAPSDPATATFLLSSETFPSRVRLTYTGEVRPISAQRLETIGHYFKSRNTPQFTPIYEQEMLLREGSTDWWIPVQTPLLPDFKEELKKGEPVTIFLIWMGGVAVGAKPDWIFLITDFEAG